MTTMTVTLITMITKALRWTCDPLLCTREESEIYRESDTHTYIQLSIEHRCRLADITCKLKKI